MRTGAAMERNQDSRSKIPPPLSGPSGQGLVEYSLILLLVTLVIFLVLKELGQTVNTHLYEPVNNAVTEAGR